MSRLRVLPPNGEAFEKKLEGEKIVIGRSSECDLVIADRFLSRKHAQLTRKGDEWLLEDLGSRNGTSLDGKRVTQPTTISEGHKIQLSGSAISVLPDTPGRPVAERSSLSDHTVFRAASDLIESHSISTETGIAPADQLTDRLAILNDVHKALSRPIDLEELLDLILARAFEHLGPEEGSVLLKGDDGSYYRAAFRSTDRDAEEGYLDSETLIDEVAEKGMAALVMNVADDERFAEANSILASGVRSLIAAPLLDPDGSLGMIALSSRVQRREFTEEDMGLLASLASVAALRIRNVALAEEAAERKRMEEELALARDIQTALLPDSFPDVAGFELHGGNIPSRGVSGDYYEAVERRNGEECVVMVADVSGKGVAASLLTASLEALTAGPIEVGQPVDEICSMVSRQLYRRTNPEKYATAFLAVLEAASGKLTYANAGHNPALLVRADGEVERLGPTGTPIGILPDSSYTSGSREMGAGDLLVIYTDGITEAADPEGEEYGTERLEELCSRERERPLDELADAVERELQEFVAGEAFADDRTLVIARRLPT